VQNPEYNVAEKNCVSVCSIAAISKLDEAALSAMSHATKNAMVAASDVKVCVFFTESPSINVRRN
jgi:hypothetical protein